jgi:hypothetical protein
MSLPEVKPYNSQPDRAKLAAYQESKNPRRRVFNESDNMAKLLHVPPLGSSSQDKLPEAGPVSGTLAPAETPPMPRRRMSADVHHRIADLDQKSREQERMNSYFMEQLNSLEAKLSKFYSRSSHGSRGGPDIDTITRMNALEEQLRREGDYRHVLEDKLRELSAAYRDVDSLVRSNQRDDRSRPKEAYRETGLELVRAEPIIPMQEIRLLMDSKIQALESRLGQGERMFMQLDRKADSGVTMISDVADKVEKRVQMLETALYALHSEHQSSVKTIDRVDSSSNRAAEELRSIVNQVENGMQSRLELRMTEVLTRLVHEQEDRLRNHEEIKTSLDIKERMTQDRLTYDRDEMRERYLNMDSFIKQELGRRDETLSSVQHGFEAQVRNLYDVLKQEEIKRNEGDVSLKDDFTQFYDTLKLDYDEFKVGQARLTDQITEMVQTEVDCRLQTEKELKNLVHTMIKGVMQEISLVKDSSERGRGKLAGELRDVQNTFSEKADLLSRYIDDEVKRTSDLVRSQHVHVKELITTLTESLKQTIITNENWKSEANRKFAKLDQGLQAAQSELSKARAEGDDQVYDRVEEMKASLDRQVAANTRILEDRIEQLAKMMDGIVDNIVHSVSHNREVFSTILNQLTEELEERHLNVSDDLQKLLREVELLQGDVDSAVEEVTKKSEDTGKQLAAVQAYTQVIVSSEKAMREHLIQKLTGDFARQIKESYARIERLKEQLEEEERIQQGNDERNLERFAEVKEEITGITENIEALNEEHLALKNSMNHGQRGVESYISLTEVLRNLESKWMVSQFAELDRSLMGRGDVMENELEGIKQNIENLAAQTSEVKAEVLEAARALIDQKLNGASAAHTPNDSVRETTPISQAKSEEAKQLQKKGPKPAKAP